MKLADFHYILPESLIASYPMPERTASRLLYLGDKIEHRQFADFADLLRPGDLLVFNNSRVIPARLFAHKKTGGKVEVLVERILEANKVLAHVRASKSLKVGAVLNFDSEKYAYTATMLGRENDLFLLQFNDVVMKILNEIGHIPLPAYMQREDDSSDLERYQTVYAKNHGSVAAPTAGLHFDEAMLEKIRARGIETAFVTLHVGAGTFQPVRCEDITQHTMHSEWIEVSEEVAEQVARTKQQGGRVIAVGTTSVRCLETANRKAYSGETAIFIYPGYQFNTVDALLTNFHLPESSLLMLVSAFAGYERVMAAYVEAIKQQYRFYSYGDCMFCEKK